MIEVWVAPLKARVVPGGVAHPSLAQPSRRPKHEIRKNQRRREDERIYITIRSEDHERCVTIPISKSAPQSQALGHRTHLEGPEVKSLSLNKGAPWPSSRPITTPSCRHRRRTILVQPDTQIVSSPRQRRDTMELVLASHGCREQQVLLPPARPSTKTTPRRGRREDSYGLDQS